MGFLDRATELLRSPQNRWTRTARRVVDGLLRVEMPVTPVHRLLASHHVLRRFVTQNLMRGLYHQPLLRTFCARAGERLLLDPGSGIPVIYGVDVELGNDIHLSGWTTLAGARTTARRPRIVVGDHTYLGHYLSITTDSEVIIGRWVRISSSVFLCGYDGHPLDPIARRTEAAAVDPTGKTRIVIEDDAWICDSSLILKGVRIGRGAVVAAHAVVTCDVPDGAIVAGNPARVVGQVGRKRSVA